MKNSKNARILKSFSSRQVGKVSEFKELKLKPDSQFPHPRRRLI